MYFYDTFMVNLMG